MGKRYCRLWEERGKYYLSDEYDLTRIVFNTMEERQGWMEGYKTEIGKELEVLPLGKIEDRSIRNLMRDQELLDNFTREDRVREFLDNIGNLDVKL